MSIAIGDKVFYKGEVYEVLGFSASEDVNGNKMVEIAWSDYKLSPTGYLAIAKSELQTLEVLNELEG